MHLTTWQTEEAPRSLQMCSRTSLKNEGWETEQMPRLVERECAARVSAHIGRVIRFFSTIDQTDVSVCRLRFGDRTG